MTNKEFDYYYKKWWIEREKQLNKQIVELLIKQKK